MPPKKTKQKAAGSGQDDTGLEETMDAVGLQSRVKPAHSEDQSPRPKKRSRPGKGNNHQDVRNSRGASRRVKKKIGTGKSKHLYSNSPEVDSRTSAKVESKLFTTFNALSREYREDSPDPLAFLCANGSSAGIQSVIYKSGAQVLDQYRSLLEIYNSYSEKSRDTCEDLEQVGAQWMRDLEDTSEMLRGGVVYGRELAESLTQPAARPRLPQLDLRRATGTQKAAVEMFQDEALAEHGMWGRAAKLLLEGWKELLLKPEQC